MPVGRLPRASTRGPSARACAGGTASRDAGTRLPRRAVAALADRRGRPSPTWSTCTAPRAGLVGRLVVRNRVPTIFQPHAWSFLAASGGVRVDLAALGALRDPLDRRPRLRQRERAAAGREARPGRPDDGGAQRCGRLGVPAPGRTRPHRGAQAARARRRADRRVRGPAVACRRASRTCSRTGPRSGPRSPRRSWCSSATGRTVEPSPDRPRPSTRSSWSAARSDVQTWLAAADVVVDPVPVGGHDAGAARGDGVRAQRGRHRCRRHRRQRAGDRGRDRAGRRRSGDGRRPSSAGSPTPTSPRRRAGTGVPTSRTHHDVTRSARQLAGVYLRLVGARRTR